VRFRLVSLLGLAGLFVSLYLLLYDLGVYGSLLCGAGSCETVQASRWAVFLWIPVPAWGVGWYGLVIFAGLRLQATAGAAPATEKLLAVLAWGGLAFSVYLTAVELFVLHAVCAWCVTSAVLTVAIFLLSAPWRAFRARVP
jgi:uncharacterized membrane protein